MARKTKAELARIAYLDSLPFNSVYFVLSYKKSGAYKNPKFPWVLTLRVNPKLYRTGFTNKHHAQEEATRYDKIIDAATCF